MAVVTRRLSHEETSAAQLREESAVAMAKVDALESELVKERGRLTQLRTNMTDNQTESELLRQRLQEEEKRTMSALEELTVRKAHVASLEEESRQRQERLRESQLQMTELKARLNSRTGYAKDLMRLLSLQNGRLARLLDRLGFSMTRQGSSVVVQKIPRSERSLQGSNDLDLGSSLRASGALNGQMGSADHEPMSWMDGTESQDETEKYEAYVASLSSFDVDAFSEAIYKRVKDVEHLARKLQREAKAYREKTHSLYKEAHDKIAFRHFKEGDLALFLPTRNQTTGAWAAFNVGFPHYFLREQEAHRLRSREWLVARIARVQERVVDLSRSLQHDAAPAKKEGTETGSLDQEENDNPFDLSDGLRWYLIDAVEDKPGAPSTPGLAKSTVAANNVEAMADMHTHARTGSKPGSLVGRVGASSGIEGVSKTLSKSLESRRSSTGSKKALPFAIGVARGRDSPLASETNSLRAAQADSPAEASPMQQQGAAIMAQQVSPQAPSVAPAGGSRESGAMDNEGRPDRPGEEQQAAQTQAEEARHKADCLDGP